MEAKKSEKANIQSWSGVFRDLGLVVALGLVLMAFTWKKTERIEITLTNNMVFADEEDMADITKEEKKPPPPPPPPEIEVVDDEEEIEEEQPEFEDMEIDEDVEIDLPEPEVDEPVVAEPIFEVVEDQPEFPGGQSELANFLKRNIVYPPMEKNNGIEGTAYVQFVVWKNGTIRDVRIFPGSEARATENMRNEAMRVVKLMPKWKAGKQRGKNVACRFMLPIKFTLR